MSQYKAVTPSKKKTRSSLNFSSQGWTAGQLVQTVMVHDWRNQWKKDLEKVVIEPETDIVLPVQLFRSRAFLDRLRKEVETTLETKLTELREFTASKRTEGSLVYDELQKKFDLEAKYKSKFVAIDVKSKELVAEGNSLEEAYANALAKSKSRSLYFRKVGRPYLLRV